MERALNEARADTHMTPLSLVGTALAISLALILLRLVWVWVSLRLTILKARRHGEHVYTPNFRLVIATSLAGVRGAITMAGVLTLPLSLPGGAPFPGRDLAIFLASAVIIVSLLVASIGLPRVLRGLEVPHESSEEAEEDRARHDAAVAAIGAIEKAAIAHLDKVHDVDVQASAANHVRGIYEHRLGGGGLYDPSRVRIAEQAEGEYRLAALQAERKAILALVHARSLSDETARKLLREIDLVEARYR
jgi:CPA1 family monovalent cation:H+ antiporter